MTQLFIRGLPKNINYPVVDDFFHKYGPCVVIEDAAGNYVVEYEDWRDAKDAIIRNIKRLNIGYSIEETFRHEQVDSILDFDEDMDDM